MPEYRRLYRPGGTYFITVVTHGRRHIFQDEMPRRCLHEAIDAVRGHWTFTILELVLLLDHFHMIFTLPDGEADFSTRVGRIKSKFSSLFLDAGGKEVEQSQSRDEHGYRGIWQKRFWEHCVRDENDLMECRKYCWFNPVKHGLTTCPHEWPYSTFHRAVADAWVDRDWWCVCENESPVPKIHDIEGAEM